MPDITSALQPHAQQLLEVLELGNEFYSADALHVSDPMCHPTLHIVLPITGSSEVCTWQQKGFHPGLCRQQVFKIIAHNHCLTLAPPADVGYTIERSCCSMALT